MVLTWKNARPDPRVDLMAATGWGRTRGRSVLSCVWPIRTGYDVLRGLLIGLVKFRVVDWASFVAGRSRHGRRGTTLLSAPANFQVCNAVC